MGKIRKGRWGLAAVERRSELAEHSVLWGKSWEFSKSAHSALLEGPKIGIENRDWDWDQGFCHL